MAAYEKGPVKWSGAAVIAASTMAACTTAAVAGEVLASRQVKRLYLKFMEDVDRAFCRVTDVLTRIASNKDLSLRPGLEKQLLNELNSMDPMVTVEGEIASLSNPLKRPIVAFNNASVPSKIAVGAIVTASAVAAGCFVNKVRNCRHENYTDRLASKSANTTLSSSSNSYSL